MHRSLMGFLMIALLVAPAASAVSASFVDEEFTIPADGSYDLTVTVTATCQEILSAMGSLSVDVSTTGLPDSFGAGTTTAEFEAADCLGASTDVSKDVTLTFTPDASAFGLDPYAFKVHAGDATVDHTEAAVVGYRSGHTLTMDQSFPYNMTAADNGVLSWNITVDIQANSQTMVMFQNLQASRGKLSGINHQILTVEEGELSRTLTATFEAPTTEWDEATIKFWNYSHCLKGSDCPPMHSQNVTWVITNGAVGSTNGGSDDGNDSPGVAPVALGLVLVAAALVVRRRIA